MSDLKGYAVVLRAVRGLNAENSWTGKTHVIKSLYIASTKATIPFEFVLFKHGPYSFDANDAIEFMSAVRMLSLKATPPYGVQLKPGPSVNAINEKVDATTFEVIDQAIKLVGKSEVKELEALATSIWVESNKELKNEEEWLTAVKQLKPHLEEALIKEGIKKAQGWINT